MKEVKAYTPQQVIDDDTIRVREKVIFDHSDTIKSSIELLKLISPYNWFDLACSTYGYEVVAEILEPEE